jgi:RND superfamily putative drug exporter
MTVVLALLGMLTVPITMFRSLAAGAIFVAVASVLAALTLLPALLALLGDRINSLRVLRHKGVTGVREGGFWDRVTHAVMRRPIASVLLSAGVLIAAAVPFFGINLGFPGVSTLPPGTDAQRAFTIMAADFSGGLDSPVEIVVDADQSSPGIRAAMEALRSTLARDSAFGPSAVETNPAGDLAVVSAPTTGDPSADASVQAIERLRDDYIPDAFSGTDANVLVGGDTAWNKDGFEIIDRYLPIVIALVLTMSFLLLTVAFRSIVVAFKAIVMNLLSVGAAYGLLVLVFQEGVGAGVLGFRQGEFVAAWLPLFLFAVLFGLSMDYHVFLLSRIREHYDQTADNAGSVAYGLRNTAGVITGAALIMVAVFFGFAAGDLVDMQQMGFGLGVAILIDATLVRTVLVPASMRLLGTRNWYLPSWLSWLPDVRVEGSEAVGGAQDHARGLRTAVLHLPSDRPPASTHDVKKGA